LVVHAAGPEQPHSPFTQTLALGMPLQCPGALQPQRPVVVLQKEPLRLVAQSKFEVQAFDEHCPRGEQRAVVLPHTETVPPSTPKSGMLRTACPGKEQVPDSGSGWVAHLPCPPPTSTHCMPASGHEPVQLMTQLVWLMHCSWFVHGGGAGNSGLMHCWF
jgi:hypothetical protein